jgi:hypothetical protein
MLINPKKTSSYDISVRNVAIAGTDVTHAVLLINSRTRDVNRCPVVICDDPLNHTQHSKITYYVSNRWSVICAFKSLDSAVKVYRVFSDARLAELHNAQAVRS